MSYALRDSPGERDRTWWTVWLRRTFSATPCLIVGFVLDGFIAGYLYATSGWHDYFGLSWHRSDRDHLEATVAFLLFVPMGPLVVTMVWGFARYFTFIRHALSRPLRPLPDTAAAALRPVTDFGLLTGLGWSVAVALGVWFFEHGITHRVEALLGFLGMMGITLIVGPQWYAHDALVRAKDQLLRVTAKGLRGESPGTWVGQNVAGADDEIRERRQFLRELREMPEWIYSPTQLIVFAAEVAVPVAALVLKR